jgi:uncharacterized protein YecE (DUF72 family)
MKASARGDEATAQIDAVSNPGGINSSYHHRMGEVRIGISGWTYKPWRGTFYPPGLAQKRELAYASRRFNSIEVNGSFYSLQLPPSYRRWHDDTPEGFVFSVKASRYITHMIKLRNPRRPLANFFASGILALGEKLGPILWQFPPGWGFDEARWEAFMELLPRDTTAAARLARNHDGRVRGRAILKTARPRPIRHAFEVRHKSFLTPRFIDLLRHWNGAFVISDSAGAWIYSEDVTTGFVYIRLHGSKELYASGYDDAELDRWAQRIGAWRSGGEPADARRIGPPAAKRKSRDIYIYFDNDAKVHAPFNALGLAARLGVEWKHELPPARTPRE